MRVTPFFRVLAAPSRGGFLNRAPEDGIDRPRGLPEGHTDLRVQAGTGEVVRLADGREADPGDGVWPVSVIMRYPGPHRSPVAGRCQLAALAQALVARAKCPHDVHQRVGLCR